MITPAYNIAEYLPRCIESVLNQSFRDLEMIVVDDGSTDATSDIIIEYTARDSRVRGFRGPNRGVSHARNVAMQHARGRYLALLDADDEWDPLFAASLVRRLEAQPEIAVVSGNALNHGGALDQTPVRPWPSDSCEIRFIDMIEHEDAVFIMSMFRREVYEAIGGFNESLVRSEDYEFWLRAAAAGFRFVTEPEPRAHYRRRPDSMSADQTAMFETIITVLQRARGFRPRARADELAAIDRKLEELGRGYLLTKGKQALLRRNFTEARTQFAALYRQGAGWHYAALWAGLRLAPYVVLKAYEARLARLGSRPNGQRVGWSPPAAAVPPSGGR